VFAACDAALEYVPRRRQRKLVEPLLADVVADGGRLIIGVFNEERDDHAMARQLAAWGFAVGTHERLHGDPRLAYRLVWIDRPR
jgi:hypothetical protein